MNKIDLNKIAKNPAWFRFNLENEGYLIDLYDLLNLIKEYHYIVDEIEIQIFYLQQLQNRDQNSTWTEDTINQTEKKILLLKKSCQDTFKKLKNIFEQYPDRLIPKKAKNGKSLQEWEETLA